MCARLSLGIRVIIHNNKLLFFIINPGLALYDEEAFPPSRGRRGSCGGRECHLQGGKGDSDNGSRTSDLDGGVGNGRAREHEHTQVLPRLLCSGLQDPAAGQGRTLTATPAPQLTPVNCMLHCWWKQARPTPPAHTGPEFPPPKASSASFFLNYFLIKQTAPAAEHKPCNKII